jgi:DNA-binding MarR family transcriptional regulator
MTPGATTAPESRSAGRVEVTHDHLTALVRLVGLYRRTFADLLAEQRWVVESGVKPPTYGVLNVVAQRGPVSQREVCDVLGVHPSDMVEIVDIVERQGWVARRRDPDDRRRYRLTLTAAGRRTLARYDAIAARAEAVVLEPLAEGERRTLLDLVAKVVAAQS